VAQAAVERSALRGFLVEHEAHEEHENGLRVEGIRDLRALRVSNLLRVSLVRRLSVSPRRHQGNGGLHRSPCSVMALVPSWSNPLF
jgi:hypothetical protein